MFHGQFLFLPELCCSVLFFDRLFDAKMEGNPQQYRAVQHIVAGTSKPAPYLVFGPPGTGTTFLEYWYFSCFDPSESNCFVIVVAGKTVTMVEAIKQIEKKEVGCHILACAPSNSATDLLCTKILEHVDKHSVFRMYASSRDPKMVPQVLKVSFALFYARCLFSRWIVCGYCNIYKLSTWRGCNS